MPLSEASAPEIEAIRRLVDFAGCRVAEIGTGDGRLAWPFAPEAALWLALDPDTAEVRLAAEARHAQVAANSQRVRLVVADGRALCLAPESVDRALFTWSLC